MGDAHANNQKRGGRGGDTMNISRLLCAAILCGLSLPALAEIDIHNMRMCPRVDQLIEVKAQRQEVFCPELTISCEVAWEAHIRDVDKYNAFIHKCRRIGQGQTNRRLKIQDQDPGGADAIEKKSMDAMEKKNAAFLVEYRRNQERFNRKVEALLAKARQARQNQQTYRPAQTYTPAPTYAPAEADLGYPPGCRNKYSYDVCALQGAGCSSGSRLACQNICRNTCND
jgi:transcription elongation factor Elf1